MTVMIDTNLILWRQYPSSWDVISQKWSKDFKFFVYEFTHLTCCQIHAPSSSFTPKIDINLIFLNRQYPSSWDVKSQDGVKILAFKFFVYMFTYLICLPIKS